MEIYFVRHTEKKTDTEDPSLTIRGLSQAKYLAKRLEKERFTEFYCSDTNRTKQTAHVISKTLNLKPKIEGCLNEFSSRILKSEEQTWDQQESERYKELLAFLKRISKEKSGNEKVLIVAHGITNRLIMAFFLEIGLKNIIRFSQSEAAINIIYWVDRFNNWRLRSWNDNCYLPSKLKFSLESY